MAEILVIHPNLRFHAGSGAVCMNTLEALQEDHSVTLFVIGDVDIDERNRFFSTNVSAVTISRNRWVDTLDAAVRMIPGPSLGLLIESIAKRMVNAHIQRYDLVISTDNELWIDCPSIEYIHFSQAARTGRWSDDRGDRYPKQLAELYKRLCGRVAPSDTDAPTEYRANSTWTASIAADALNVPVGVLYPPVYTEDIEPKPWDERENRILTVGRIDPDKNILRNIDIVAGLRERGHEIQYDIVGQTTDHYDEYAKLLHQQSDRHEFVHHHGRLPREQLVELLASSRYGLHGKEYEHFGIGVAELVAGGAIPFLPASGGQREIVDHDERILYESVEDAITKMDRTLRSESRQQAIRDGLPNVTARFGRQRFQDEISELVTDVLQNEIGNQGVL